MECHPLTPLDNNFHKLPKPGMGENSRCKNRNRIYFYFDDLAYFARGKARRNRDPVGYCFYTCLFDSIVRVWIFTIWEIGKATRNRIKYCLNKLKFKIFVFKRIESRFSRLNTHILCGSEKRSQNSSFFTSEYSLLYFDPKIFV